MWTFIEGLESSDAYAAFEEHRDQDPRHRSLASTARRYGVAPTTIYRWSKENYWESRIQSYDAHMAALRAAELAQREQTAVRAWGERREELLALGEEAALLGLEQNLHDLKTRRGRMRWNEAKGLLGVVLREGNLANGDATDRVDNVIDLSNASDETLAALEQLREHGAKNGSEE